MPLGQERVKRMLKKMVGSPSFRNLFMDAFLAAREFGAFLIRKNLIEASDLPILQCQEPEVIYIFADNC